MINYDRDRRKDRRIALLILGFNLIYYSLFAWFFPFISADGFLYLALAKNFFSQGYVLEGQPHEKFLPFYPFLMALGAHFSSHRLSVETWGRVINILAGAAASPLLFFLTRTLGASRFASGLMASVASLSMIGIHQYIDINVMPLFHLFLLLALFSLFQKRFFLFGMISGLAAMTRFEAYLLLPFFLWIHRQQLRSLAATAAGFVLAAFPWFLRNVLVFGNPLHTVYWGELFLIQLNLKAMAWDALREFGPVVGALFVLGFNRLSREAKIYLGGFGLLYFLLHLVWWRYNQRFLLPLMPVLLLPGALGADRVLSTCARHSADKTTWIRAALAGLIAAQLLTVTTGAVIIGRSRPYDPVGEVARLIKDRFPHLPVITSYQPALAYYLEQPVFSLDSLSPEADPHAFLVEKFHRHGVRLLVWSSAHPLDWERFSFLRAGKTFTVVTDSSAGKVKLIYLFLGRVGELPRQILIYELIIFPTP